jgi:hypothetical protein
VCGEEGRPILFGLPSKEGFEAAERGEYVLGGCVLPSEPVNRACPNAHRWDDRSSARP